MNTNISLGYLASALGGAGISELSTDFNRALILIGLAVTLVITTAVLNKFGVPVSGRRK